MTDQNDPRNSGQPSGDSEPTEVWSRQPDQPTEQYGTVSGAPDQPTEYFGQAGGPNPTQAFPPYNPQFDPQAPPQGATAPYPPYNPQQYGQTQQFGQPQQYGQTQQYPGAGGGGVPPEQPFITDASTGGGKNRKVGTWIAAGVVGLLIAVIAIIGFSVFGSRSSDTQTAFVPPTSSTRVPTTTPEAPSTNSPLENLPGGLGDVIGGAGGAVGTIATNDGKTLVINSIGGSKVTILTTPDTQLIALNRSSIADLQPGDAIVVDGTPVENGSMTAKTIVSTALPSFGN